VLVWRGDSGASLIRQVPVRRRHRPPTGSRRVPRKPQAAACGSASA
jgi:hypothetical protein